MMNIAEPENGLNMWAGEIHKGVAVQAFKVEKTLFSSQSPFQKIDIVQTAGHGAMLINDGVVMTAERDEFVYHEMIAHVPLFVHPKPETVLIIGGGDGGTAREILKHRQVKRVVMVEIDEMVVAACRKHMPALSCALDDPRLEIRFEDGVTYVAETQKQFDAVIVDSTDPKGPGAVLFSAAFYEKAASVLTQEGIMITQTESPFYDQAEQKALFGNQRPFFQHLHMYLYSNLTYPGGLWSFGFASKKYRPLDDSGLARAATSDIPTRYYTPHIHRAAFMLPGFINEAFTGLLDPVSP